MFDYLIVGAGFAGSVLAERLTVGSNKKVLICDKRPHIGGNAYDHYNRVSLNDTLKARDTATGDVHA
jgi:UDP-galactopyranose mutase